MRHSVIRTFVSLVLLNLFLFLQLAAFSHDIHAAVHDCDEAQHECAITLLSNGHLDLAPPTAMPLLVETHRHVNKDAPSFQISAHDDYSPPGRAPPFSQS